MEDKKNIDEAGNRINAAEYPLLNLFKIFNSGVLMVILVFIVYSSSMVLKLLLVSSLVLGFTSLFIPAKKNEIKNFSVLSACLYIGPVVFYLGN